MRGYSYRLSGTSSAPESTGVSLRHNGMYFFDILTSKSYPTLGYIVNFDLEMCFALQRHADILISKSGPKMGYFVDLEIYVVWQW